MFSKIVFDLVNRRSQSGVSRSDRVSAITKGKLMLAPRTPELSMSTVIVLSDPRVNDIYSSESCRVFCLSTHKVFYANVDLLFELDEL